MYSEYEKQLYKQLFKAFQKGEYHYEFPIPNDPYEKDKLYNALRHLDEGGILLFFEDDSDDSYMVELSYTHCYQFVEI